MFGPFFRSSLKFGDRNSSIFGHFFIWSSRNLLTWKKSWSSFIPPILKIGQNWRKMANYPPNAQHKSAPLTSADLSVYWFFRFLDSQSKPFSLFLTFHFPYSISVVIRYCSTSLFIKLTWPGGGKKTFRSSSRAANCPPAYLTKSWYSVFPLSLLIAERQAGKLWIFFFLCFDSARYQTRVNHLSNRRFYTWPLKRNNNNNNW